MKQDIAIFTPMANEEKNAKKFVLDVLSYKKFFKKFKYFIILDNASNDKTFNIVKKLEKKNKELKVVWCPKNKTVVDAYMEGYKNCLMTNHKWILEIDAGGSHKPRNIKGFLKFMTDDYSCIFGSRFCKGGKLTNYNFIRFFFSKGGSIISKLFFNINLKDTTSGFQIFNRLVVKKIIQKKLISRDRFFQTEIKIFTRKLKFKEVPITYVCKTHHLSFFSIIESVYLLFKIRLIKNNFFKG
jgi:dolichol-phosphate mannosyltransferase